MAAVVMALLGGTAGATEIALAVRGVQLERLGQSRRVRIALSRAPDGIRDYRLEAPPRLVIELDGPASRTPVPTTRFPLADDVVTEVRASPHDGRLWAVLALGPATGAHVVRREGATLVADLGAPPAVVPVAVAAAAAPPAPIALAVRDVRVEPQGSGRRVTIALTRAPDDVRHFVLDDPRRVVIDLAGPHAAGDVATRFAVTDDVVAQVRAAPQEGGVRAVIDLQAATVASVRVDGATVVADLDPTSVTTPGRPGDIVGRRVGVIGRWTGNRIEAVNVEYHEGQKAADLGRITGPIDTIDPNAHRLQIGPLVGEWTDGTVFDHVTVESLTPGVIVTMSGKLIAPGQLRVDEIYSERLEHGVVEIVGGVTTEERHDDDTIALTVLGAPVLVPRTVPLREATLARRLDERRPVQQLTVSILDRPLTIGGKVETNTDYFWNRSLRTRNGHEAFEPDALLQPEFLYAVSRNTLVFLQGALFYSGFVDTNSGASDHQFSLERGETWLYMGELMESPFGLQVGRQNFRETRSWWWDDNLDALRVYYDRRKVHGELAVARELASFTTEHPRVRPDVDGVVRILANVAWGWRDGHRLDFFGLQQLDGSDEPRIGSRVTDRNRDKSDADLLWLGGRASGRTYGSLGDLEYFADGAGVGGHETLLQVDDDRERFSGRSSHDVLGFAFDGRATWRTRVPGRPAFTVGYAVGSGDAHRGRGTDHDFRQTGLQLDRDRFRGVDRFPYYGALLRPELSNLQVVTAAVGFRFLPDSSIELLYHVYRQVEPAPVVRGSHLDIDPGGKHADIGQEWDAVLGLREWEHVDLQLIGALFRSGSAFGDRSGSLAEGAFLKFRYNF